jgi:NhaP-type Na+/H+ or K+/H+ antiporter
MKIDAYSILIVLSVLVVLSYFYNYVAKQLKIPSVLLLIASGVGLQYASKIFGLNLPFTKTLLEILGITGLIFIVLEASLDLKLEKGKNRLISRAFLSALGLLAITAGLVALVFFYHYETTFREALIHAIPFSIISSAIAIPSVSNMEADRKEFVVYESTFSDIMGIVAFNFVVADSVSGWDAAIRFGWQTILILIISIGSTASLIWLLANVTTHVRFFLTFAIIILTYSLSKFLHLPSLILVLCFGLVMNNFKLFTFPVVRQHVPFQKLDDALKELKVMTVETAFIIRTFFFLLFGYSVDVALLTSREVLVIGVIIIVLTLVVRSTFLKFLLRISSAPLALIAPRGLITILLFYSIPENMRIENLSEGVLFVVIALTAIAMTIGLLLSKKHSTESMEEII